MSKLNFDDEPPQTARVSAYDERHLVTYIRLLEAERQGASWQEVAQIIFGIDPVSEAVRAKRMYDTHLARAHWMVASGYRHLLEPRLQ